VYQNSNGTSAPQAIECFECAANLMVERSCFKSDMAEDVHSSAVIGANVTLGQDSKIEPFSVIGDNVMIGRDVSIGPNVTIESGVCIGDGAQIEHGSIVKADTRLGNGCRVGPMCVLGQRPSRARSSTLNIPEDLSPLVVSEGCYVGCMVVLYVSTKVGRECFIADMAQIRERCNIGDNVIVGRGVTVEQCCSIGQGSKLQSGAYVTALSEIGELVFVAPMVVTTNDNYMGRTEARFAHKKGFTARDGARIGAGAVILPGVTIGREGVVGAGGVLTRDCDDYKIVVGVPAREFRDVDDEHVLFKKP
jgi:UDP-2-acetamido-3-amino-2,3-dideoxy-glucuronate N-acetyltransferase